MTTKPNTCAVTFPRGAMERMSRRGVRDCGDQISTTLDPDPPDPLAPIMLVIAVLVWLAISALIVGGAL